LVEMPGEIPGAACWPARGVVTAAPNSRVRQRQVERRGQEVVVDCMDFLPMVTFGRGVTTRSQRA
jgi:hypothetical protein